MTHAPHAHDGAAHPSVASPGHSAQHGGAFRDSDPSGHLHASSASLAEMLDLDARVMGGFLPVVAGRLAELAPGARTVVDLGAGTGAGSLALAEAFPSAVIHAVDVDPGMLSLVEVRAGEHGLAGRVLPVSGDFDSPDLALPAPADVMWASGTLHHAADPGALLRAVHHALRPGGVIAVLEMTDPPRPIPLGPGEDDLAQRVAAFQTGWTSHPDWAPHLEGAGLEMVEQREIEDASPSPELAREWSTAWLARVRDRAAAGGPAPDADLVAGINALLVDAAADRGPLGAPDLVLTSRRTLWIARRPE